MTNYKYKYLQAKKLYFNMKGGSTKVFDLSKKYKFTKDVQKNLNWSNYSNIVGREAKFNRHTIEEIDEETYKNKIKKSNSTDANEKTVSIKDCKK